jgi:DNA mismatch endonuclease (patch repair protein)
VDRLTKAERSAVMSRIRAKGNERTELVMARMFRAAGLNGWRRHLTIRLKDLRPETMRASDGTRFLPRVRPDFTFPTAKLALFVDGCFWHGCPRCYRSPKTRSRFWRAKVGRNQERDLFQTRALRRRGWRVLRVRECALSVRRAEATLRRIARALGQT